MAWAATVAFWFHSALCAGFLVLLTRVLRGHRLAVAEAGPSPASWSEQAVEGVFYLSAGLYLLYAELYLLRIKTLAQAAAS